MSTYSIYWHNLFLYSDVKAKEIWQQRLDPRLGQLRGFLEATFPENCLDMELTSRSVQFNFIRASPNAIDLKVDLLVSPFWGMNMSFIGTYTMFHISKDLIYSYELNLCFKSKIIMQTECVRIKMASGVLQNPAK